MEKPFSLGDGIMRFFLVKQSDNSSRLVVRLSHAEYDGISLPSMLQDIRAAYEGTGLSINKPYSAFINHIRALDLKQSEKFWSSLLDGSQMTNVLHHKSLPYKNPVDRMLSGTAGLSTLTHPEDTFASIVKASWALVLSSLACTPDTVFGHVVSGRNGSLTGIQDIVGPCINIIPARIPLQAVWTSNDLMRFVQNQHLTSMHRESFGMRHIIERGTSWPLSTRFSTIHQHTNFRRQFFGEVLSGSAGSKMSGYSPPHEVADVWIWTAPVSGDQFSVDLTFADAEDIVANAWREVFGADTSLDDEAVW